MSEALECSLSALLLDGGGACHHPACFLGGDSYQIAWPFYRLTTEDTDLFHQLYA